MKIVIIGYGKMGKEIEKIARSRGHEIVLIVDELNSDSVSASDLSKADVAIEFTNPEVAYSNISKCFQAELPVVSGTTGWTQRIHELKHICETEGKTLFYAPNFSIGVNLFFKLNTFLAKLMKQHSEFSVQITETHHTKKKDAPSGTAIKLADDIIAVSDTLDKWQLNTSKNESELQINAIREGEVFGIHTIDYETDTDLIQISHKLKNRESLAVGAVIAAEFAQNKYGFLTMDDLLKF